MYKRLLSARRFVAFLSLIFFVCPSVFAATYYVDAASPGDSRDGLTTATAWKTLQHAADNAVAGDTIYVMPGTYEGFLIGADGHRGTASAKIRMISQTPKAAIIIPNPALTGPGEGVVNVQSTIGTNTCVSDTNRTPCVDAFWEINGFDIDAQHVGYYAVKMESGGLTLLNNRIHSSTRDLIKMVAAANDVEIGYNEVFDSGRDPSGNIVDVNSQGVDITASGNVHVHHNYFHDTVDSGIYPKGNAEGIVIEDNKIANARTQGIYVGAPTSTLNLRYQDRSHPYATYDAIVRNNVIIGTGFSCIKVASSYGTKVYNNSCHDTARTRDDGGIMVVAERDNAESYPAQPNTNIYIYNNIVEIAGTAGQNVVSIYEASTADTGPLAMTNDSTLYMDYNLYRNRTGTAARFSWPRRLDQNIYTRTLNDWRSVVGLDLNSQDVDPQYSPNPDNADTTLTIAASSPAVDHASPDAAYCNVPDYAGVARPQNARCDIGANEVPGTSPPPAAPQAAMTATPTSGTSPLTVNFNGSGSSGQPTSYTWNFGDGSTGTGVTASHVYSAAATQTFTARLTVSNANGSSTTTTAITVNPSTTPPPSPSTRIEQNDPSITLGPNTWTWSSYTDANASGGSAINTDGLGNNAGAYLRFSFTGTGIKWLGWRDSCMGQANFVLDGNTTLVDAYQASGAWTTVYQVAGLANTTHTVEINVLGTKNATSCATFVNVDAFDITH